MIDRELRLPNGLEFWLYTGEDDDEGPRIEVSIGTAYVDIEPADVRELITWLQGHVEDGNL